MDARERFRATRAAIPRLNDVKLLLMNDCEDWKPPQVKAKTDKSDPTANQAIYNVDERAEKIEALRREESELEDLIGTSLAIIEAVRNGFGEEYANLLDARYIDNSSWKDIQNDYGIARRTGYNMLSVAFDWIDSVGISRLLKGETEV